VKQTVADTAAQAPPRRRVLLSAYACSPLWGSEPGVGWRWALELSKRHEVMVVTHAYFKDDIDDALRRQPCPGLHFTYFRAPHISGHPHRELNSRLYYLLWQATVRRHVARLVHEWRPDALHHLTWGSYRLPTFLGALGVPLVIGPVGGGEGAPRRLYRSWPWREYGFYSLRACSIVCSRWDPLVRLGLRHAACVLTKTAQTRQALPLWVQGKAFEAGETGIADALQCPPPRALTRSAPPSSPAGRTLQLLFAGRLLGGKGITYLLAAMQLLRARRTPAHLTVAGDGRLLKWAQRTVARQGLAACVSLLGKVPREQMTALYDSSDLLAFPSWHDSSGNVVTEALARGLPVLCLDIGGPRYVVDPSCAVVVSVGGLDEAGLALALADQIEALAQDPERLAQLARGACTRARELSWASQVARAYDQIEQRLGWTSAPARTQPSACA
jgi:glycosyltransferase involved in cell wall biosynthesis